MHNPIFGAKNASPFKAPVQVLFLRYEDKKYNMVYDIHHCLVDMPWMKDVAL